MWLPVCAGRSNALLAPHHHKVRHHLKYHCVLHQPVYLQLHATLSSFVCSTQLIMFPAGYWHRQSRCHAAVVSVCLYCRLYFAIEMMIEEQLFSPQCSSSQLFRKSLSFIVRLSLERPHFSPHYHKVDDNIKLENTIFIPHLYTFCFREKPTMCNCRLFVRVYFCLLCIKLLISVLNKRLIKSFVLVVFTEALQRENY